LDWNHDRNIVLGFGGTCVNTNFQESLRVFDSRSCSVGEGPIAIGLMNNEVWWVDILGKRVLSKNLVDHTTQELSFDEDVSFVIPCSNSDFIVGNASGPLRITRDGIVTALPTRENSLGKPDGFPLRWNDAKVAPDGHLWLGTIAYDVDSHPTDCSLFRLDKTGKTLTKVVDGIGISNGLAWSADGKTMFFIDTVTLSIDSFDYKDGELANRKRRWTAPDSSYGSPDGMCIDSEDGLWVAFWGGAKVRRFNTQFEVTDEIELPQPFVTSCVFAGKDLNQLIITTARFDQSSNNEDLGKTYIAHVSIPGMQTHLFPS
jgi:gluconolactonase